VNQVPSIIDLLQKAVVHHQDGRLDAAERLYSKVIARDPRNVDALNLLAVIAQSRNHIGRAKSLFARALEAGPGIANVHFNFGNLLASIDDADAAVAAYSKAVFLDPQFAEAHLNLGVLFHKVGRFVEAISSFRNVTAIVPKDPRGHFNLGQCFSRLEQHGDAEACLLRAVALNPAYLEAHLMLATQYTKDDRVSEAITHLRRCIEIKPIAEYYSNLGDLLKRHGDPEGALAAHHAAVNMKPADALILHNYGNALGFVKQFNAAKDAFKAAISHDPRFIKAYTGLAKVYERQALLPEAVSTLQQALSLAPNDADVLSTMSMLQLIMGDFEKGWLNYQNRMAATRKPIPKRPTPPPYWQGEELGGKSILLWTEQGIGDEIVYGSMIPDVLARAGRCVLECTPRMAPIFARSFPGLTVVPYQVQGVAAASAEGIDYQTAVADLGPAFRTSFDHFPKHNGYLKADPARTAALRARYKDLAQGRKIVGIAWRSKNEDIGEMKCADLATWAAVLKVPGVLFVNLQYGDCADELAAVKSALDVDVFDDREINALKSMDDFFAQVAAMDLVISTSNTAIHVAGSLNVATWLLLPQGADSLWYWFQDRNDSPWYPSVRIFRQPSQDLEIESQPWWRDPVAQAGGWLRANTQRI